MATPHKWATALQAMGAGLQGGNPGPIVQNYHDALRREETKQAIGDLMGRSNIAGPQRELLATLPLEAQQQWLLQDMERKRKQGIAQAAAARKEREKQEAIKAMQGYVAPQPVPGTGPLDQDGQANPVSVFNPQQAAPPTMDQNWAMRVLTDPRLNDSQRERLMDVYGLHNQPAKDRRIIKGADGYNYYDTGERVLPGVTAPEKQPPVPAGFRALQMRAAEAGLAPGTHEYQQFMLNGGREQDSMGLRMGPDGSVVFGQNMDFSDLTGTSRADAERTQAALASINDGLTAYQDLFSEGGPAILPGQQKDALVTARRDLQLQMKELFNLGVLNGPDLMLMDSMLVDATDPGNYALDMLGIADLNQRVEANVAQLREQLYRLATPKLQRMGVTVDDVVGGSRSRISPETQILLDEADAFLSKYPPE